jgi:hypothetical protein
LTPSVAVVGHQMETKRFVARRTLQTATMYSSESALSFLNPQ